MSRHVIDVLLRPPVELWTSLVAALCAGVALLAPSVLLLPRELSLVVAAAMLLLAVWRGHQACRAIRYQWRLKRLRPYRIGANRLPLSRHKLYLGRGFAWGQRHTQRLRDTLRPELQRYVSPGRLYRWARRKETQWEHRLVLQWIARWLRQPILNPLAPLPSIGGNVYTVGSVILAGTGMLPTPPTDICTPATVMDVLRLKILPVPWAP